MKKLLALVAVVALALPAFAQDPCPGETMVRPMPPMKHGKEDARIVKKGHAKHKKAAKHHKAHSKHKSHAKHSGSKAKADKAPKAEKAEKAADAPKADKK